MYVYIDELVKSIYYVYLFEMFKNDGGQTVFYSTESNGAKTLTSLINSKNHWI